ncbi:hypothetical protein Tco_0749742 [Tanacetum coccineum]|uniref:Uncharacterized protein n=1 Tax=Tanacetum coccineum TaxID=301880 RepID=A0ABQ4Z0L3_9ASTR
MEHYLSHTDYLIWEVIQKGNGPVSVSTDTNEVIKVLPPKTAEENLARERERKARTTLLMALSEDHLAKFHKMTDAKDMENSSSYTDELMYSFFANQSSGPQLDHEDLEQLDEFDLEEMDLKWQVATILIRLKKFYKKTGRRSKGNQENRRRDAGNTGYKAKDNGRRPGKQEESKSLVTLDGEGVDWTGHAEDEQENFALMAYINSGSDTKREQLGDASIEIKAYTLALAKMSTKDKSGLGYKDQVHNDVLSYENEVFQSVFDSRLSDVEDSPVHDRFENVKGMHAVPPPMIGNYMPPGPDREVDNSMFTYGPKQSKTSESDTQTSNFNSCESNSSIETLEPVPKPVVVEPKVVSQPKVWSDAPIIEEYESDSDDEYVIQPSKEQEKPSFAFVNTVKHVKTPRETVKEQNTYSPSPKADKRDWNGLMSKRLGLGYGFTKKACFVCGSFSHLIRDCDFHEKRMAKQVELNKKKGKGTGQGENRPVWNNVQRLNHQNKFVPKAVLTKTGIFPVNTARQNLSSQAATTSTARKVNTARPILTDSMNYQPVTAENKANKTASPKEANNSAGTQDYNDAGNSKMEAEPAQEYSDYIHMSSITSTIKSSEAKNGSEKPNGDIDSKTNEEPVDQAHQIFFEELERSYQNGIYRPFVIFSHTKHVFLGI